MALLKQGDKIRLKVKTVTGWKGYGTVTRSQYSPDDVVFFEKDGNSDSSCIACRHEVAKVRHS